MNENVDYSMKKYILKNPYFGNLERCEKGEKKKFLGSITFLSPSDLKPELNISSDINNIFKISVIYQISFRFSFFSGIKSKSISVGCIGLKVTANER